MKWGHYADKEGMGTNIMATNIIYYQRYDGYNGYRNIMISFGCFVSLMKWGHYADYEGLGKNIMALLCEASVMVGIVFPFPFIQLEKIFVFFLFSSLVSGNK